MRPRAFELEGATIHLTPHPGPLLVGRGEGEAFAYFVWFAVHLIRPAATFSPSDAEKEFILWDDFPA
jgi:hypothetical protein